MDEAVSIKPRDVMPEGARTLPACLLAIDVGTVVELARRQLGRV